VKQPIEFFTFEELWQEISRRSETAVLSFVGSKDTFGNFVSGNPVYALGMAKFMMEMLTEKCILDVYGEDEEDEEGPTFGTEEDCIDG